jgi:ferredoxin
MATKHWSRLLRASARAFMDEADRIQGFSLFDRLHGYVYARWPYLYISVATGQHPLSRLLKPLVGLLPYGRDGNQDGASFADSYHGKVVPLDAAKQLVTVKEEIRLMDLERVIPYAHARDIVLQHPDHIVVLECPCRAARPEPCQPLDVCLVIGEPFASFVLEHHPRRSRWITPQEAVDILAAEAERGHVSHAFFKDAMLQRFYAICNCCACCCGAMQAHQHGTPMLAPSGHVSSLDADLCIGCGTCAEHCQFDAISIDGSLAVLNTEACMGCGVCVVKCPEGAFSLVRDPAKGEPLEIQALMAAAAHSTLPGGQTAITREKDTTRSADQARPTPGSRG